MRNIVLTITALFLTLSLFAQQTPYCQAPDTITLSGLTSTGVTLNWGLTAGQDAPTLYTLTLKDRNRITIFQDNALSAPYLTHTLTGLTPNTTYIAELTGNCNASSSGFSTTASVSFTTLCGAGTVPYTQNFDTLTALPVCTYSSSAVITYVGRSGKGLAFHTTSSKGAYFVFPELTIASDMVECSLWMKPSSVAEGSIPVQIGLVTDPADIGSSFEPLYSGYLSDLQWKEIQMNTTNTILPVASTAMIAISIPAGFDADVYLDDVSIHQVPTCVRPEDFYISNILSTSATLSWSTTNASDCRLYISSSEGNTSILASTVPFNLTGLTPNTTYTLSLRGICSPTDSSELCRNVITFTTRCDVAPSPLFHETFDTLSVEGSIPECWESGWFFKPEAVTAETPFTSTTYQVHSGTRAMMLQNMLTGTSSYLSSRLLPIDSAGKYSLSVWVYRQNASSTQLEALRFWSSPSYNSTANATLLGSVSLHYQAEPAEPTPNMWYNYDFLIPSVGNQYIIIEGVSENGAVVYFDDLQVIPTPSCMKVSNIHLDNITSSSVELLWNPGNAETQWEVSYTLTQNASIVASVTDTLSSPSLTISGLSTATVYSLTGSVKALCSASDTSASVSFANTFTTLCLPIGTLPYSCGFESGELSVMNYPLPFCWQRRNDASASFSMYPNATSSASYARTGNGYLRFFPNSSKLYRYGSYQMAVLPELDDSIDLTSLRLVYYTRMQESYSTHSLLVGVVSDPDSLSSLVVIDSFAVSGITYQRHEVLFDSYSGEGRQIVLMVHRATIDQPVLIVDDLVLEHIPSCRGLLGTGVEISDINDISARVVMVDSTVTTWQYAVGLTGTPVSSLTPVTVTASNTVLTSLLPYTSYSVYARRLCGSEYGEWCDPVTFRTSCSPATLPFTEDFESQPLGALHGCFIVEMGEPKDSLFVINSASGAVPNQTYNHTSGGSHGLSSSEGAAVTSLGSFSSAFVYVHLEAGQLYEFSLYAHTFTDTYRNYSYDLSFLLGPSLSSLSSIGDISVNSAYFERYAVSFTASATGDYFMGFRTSVNVGGNEYIPYIDDIHIEQMACAAPTSVVVDDLTSTSAVLEISSTGSEWQVLVSSFPISLEGTIDPDVLNDTVTSLSVSLSGLRPNDDYYYVARTICPNGETSPWTAPQSFHTRCTQISLPYDEGFEAIGSTNCWSKVGTGTVSRATDMAFSDKASLCANAATVISPQINVVTLAPYQFSAWVRSPGVGTNFSVGVIVDPDDISTFEIIESFTVQTADRWTEITVPFSILNDPEYLPYYNARHILLAVSGDSSLYVDDIHVGIPPSCPKPAAASLSSVTANSAVVDWTESGSATSWRIRIVPASGTETTIDVTSHPYTVTGLNPASIYRLYVSSLCSSTDHSEELDFGQFSTACGIVTAPYYESFDLQPRDTTPECWDISASTVYLSPLRDWGVRESAGNRLIRMSNWGLQDGDAIICSPMIYIPEGANYELAYDYTNQATCGPLYVKVRRTRQAFFSTLASHPNSGESTSEASTPISLFNNRISLSSYSGDTIIIQFMATADNISGDGSIFVDNVRVRVVNPCVAPSVAIKSVTENTARFLITDSLHTSWQYAYGHEHFDVTSAQPLSTSSKSITLSSLSSFTFYDIYVRAVCGANSFSDWQRITFQTTATPTSLPYSTDFSDAADNALWLPDGDETNSFVFGTDTAALINSTHALYVSADGVNYGYTVDINSMACISRLFSFEDTLYNIEFDWQCTGGKFVLNGVADYGRFYLMPAYANTLPTGEGMYYKFYFWDKDIIPLDGDTSIQLIPGVNHLSRSVNMAGRSGAYRLVFLWSSEENSGNSHYPLSVANLSIAPVTCPEIANLVVPAETITRTSAYVHCDNSAPSLRWVVSTSALLADSVLTGVSVTDTFTIRGLLPSSRYHLFVRAECPADDHSPWADAVFNTLCGPITSFPHFEDFEDVSFPPYCWSASGWSRFANRPYQYAHGTGCAQAGYNADQPLVSPELLLEADRQYYVSFYLLYSDLSYNNDQLEVYISPSTSIVDGTLLNTYTTYDPAATSTELVFYSLDIPEGLSGLYHIIFSASGVGHSRSVYLDDVTFDVYPRCRVLKNAPTVSAHTSTSVTLSVSRNNYTSMQFGIAPYSSRVSTADISAIYDTSYITGLTPSTAYSIYARGICSFSGDTTAWSPYVLVTTRSNDCFPPDGITFLAQTSDTMATLGWNTVPDVTLYQIVLTSPLGADTLTTASTSISLSPLTANTTYTFAIRGFCSLADTTAWSTTSFTTLRTPALIPYSTGFEPNDDNALWHNITSAFSNFVIGTDGGGRRSGTQGLYISSDGNTYSQSVPTGPGYGDIYGTAYMTRTVYFHEAGDYELSFDWKCDPISDDSYGYYNAYGRAFIAPVDASLAVDNYLYASKYPAGSIGLASEITGSQTWQRSSLLFSVEEAGYRDIVLEWYTFNKGNSTSAGDLSDYPFAVDNLSLELIHCRAVDSLRTVTYADTFAVVKAERSLSVPLEYTVIECNSEDSITTVLSTLSDTIRLNGLTPETTYWLFVRQVCDSVYSSSWRYTSFRTTPPPATLPYVCGFEDTEENNNWRFTQNQQNQLIIGINAHGDGSGALYVSADGSSNTYNVTAKSYAFASRALYLTPGRYYASFDWRNVGEAKHDYSRIFLYPADLDLPLGTYLFQLGPAHLPYVATAVDQGAELVGSASFTNMENVFTVTREGSYNLVVSWYNDEARGANPPFVVDNINIHATSCYPPSISVAADLQGEGTTSAIISSPHPGIDILYAVSLSSSFKDAVLVDTLHSSLTASADTVLLAGLSPSTAYYLLARSLCSGDDYSVVASTSFITPCGLITRFPYYESFESVSTTYIPDMISSICWTPYGASTSTSGNPRYLANTTYANVSDGSRSLQLVAHRTTPMVLALPEMADISTLRLSFDVLYDGDRNMPVLTAGYLTDLTDASSFVPVTATTASSTYTNYVVSFTGAPAGSYMAFRFVGGSTNGRKAYLDNVAVLHVVEGGSYNDTVCYADDYNANGFSIPADSIPVGLSVHQRTVKPSVISHPDTIYTVTLLKRPAAISTFHDTICGGTPYVSGIWNIPAPVTRRYHQVFPNASQYGCDSTAELFLEVIPTSHVIRDTICHGDSYQFGDQTLTAAGCYVRSYPSTLGCVATDTLYLSVVADSVHSYASLCQANLPYRWYGQDYYATGRYVTSITGPHSCAQTAVLHLTVFAADTTLNISLCSGGSVLVIDTVISDPGTYTLSRYSAHGCYVNYHLNVVETPVVPEDVYDIACEGKPYSGNGITSLLITADTVVTITTRSVDNRCDSVANVHLTLHYTHHSDTNAVINPGDNFTWHDQTYTTPGDYPVVLHCVDGCDSIVTLHLALGVDDVRMINISIVPNPLTLGATALVYGDFGEITSVEIVNSVGQTVDTFTPHTYPIEISGIHTAGLYYVRLTTPDGHRYMQKLIVK